MGRSLRILGVLVGLFSCVPGCLLGAEMARAAMFGTATIGVSKIGVPTIEAAASAAEEERLLVLVASALESGDAAGLAVLFPRSRKVSVSFNQIADLDGFVGSGPVVEALRRYLSARTDIRFEGGGGSSGRGKAERVRVRGALSSRDRGGRREKIGLCFAFERIEGEGWRCVEARETG